MKRRNVEISKFCVAIRMGNVASALLNTGIVCAGITATVGYAILLLSPVDSIVMESGKNSYEVQLFPFLDAFSRFKP